MNNQEAFDKVAKHLLTQRAKAMKTPTVCAYRAADGKTCAVGCLIPDDLYYPAMEGSGVGAVRMNFPEIRKFFEDVDNSMLSRLQSIHDHHEVSLWRMGLDGVAKEFSLDRTILDKEFVND